MILPLRSGFDTTILGNGEQSLGNILNDELFISGLKSSTKDNKERSFEVKALYYNIENNCYETFHTFNFTIHNTCELLVINLNENIKSSYINKEIISNLLYFSSKIGAKNIFMILSRKSKDYGKFN